MLCRSCQSVVVARGDSPRLSTMRRGVQNLQGSCAKLAGIIFLCGMFAIQALMCLAVWEIIEKQLRETRRHYLPLRHVCNSSSHVLGGVGDNREAVARNSQALSSFAACLQFKLSCAWRCGR